MQTSRILRTSVASAVLGLGAVTAVAATAEAAPASPGPAATASTASSAATASTASAATASAATASAASSAATASTASAATASAATASAASSAATASTASAATSTAASSAATASAAATATATASAASAVQHAAAVGRTQSLSLSDGSTAHVTRLADHTWQAWITHEGVRIAALDCAHKSQRVHGYTYVLNQANGFVGVVHPGGWHSEQNVPPHPARQHTHHKHNGHKHNGRKTHDHKNKHHKKQTGKTRDVRLADGATAHVTQLPNGSYQAWITRHGVRIAALDAGHSTARAHGHHYTLNARTGAVHLR